MRFTITLLVTIISTQLFAQDSLDIKIGQMIMVGIDGRTSLPENDAFRSYLKEGKVGGVLLFEKNISKTNSKERLKQLNADLQEASLIKLFVSIDEEGGKVHRLKKKYGFLDMPSAASLGKLDNADTTLYYNRLLAATLADVGINMNYAPVVDLAANPNNPVIVKVQRSFSSEPLIVTKHAMSCILAHKENGVITILKHFPGHGSSTTDSHKGIVDVTNSWSHEEMTPYMHIINGGMCDAVMTAHIVNKQWDSTGLPATLSKAVITDSLRGSLGFRGVVISDDMNMHAISKNYGYENAIKLAINAGVDMLMFGNNIQASQGQLTPAKLHPIIKKLVVDGEVSEERVDESYQRIMKLKGYQF